MNKHKLLVVLVLLPVVCSLFFSVGSVSAYDLELDDYAHYKVIAYEAGVGAGTDYQVVIVAHYGTGTDGTMSLNGETVALLHVGDIQADFDDVRFANQFGEILTYKRCSYTSAVNATFVVKVEANLDVDQLVYVYFGNLAAVGASSDNALVDIVGNCVLGLPLNEGAGNPQDHSGNANHGTLGAGGASPSWVTTGKFGNALSFGGDDYFTCADQASNRVFGGDFTVVAFLNLTNNDSKGIWGKSTGVGTGYLRQEKYDTNVLTPTLYDGVTVRTQPRVAYVTGSWHMYALRRVAATNVASIFWDTAKVDDTTDLVEAGLDPRDSIYVGAGLAGNLPMTGLISVFLVFNDDLTDSQLSNISSNYPDVCLVVGSVLVRKWATTTLPAVAGVSDVVDNVAFSPVVDGALTDTEWFISGLLLVLALANVVLLAFPFALLRFVFGVLSFALSGWAFTYGGLPLAPYLQIMGLVVSVVCMFLATRARE